MSLLEKHHCWPQMDPLTWVKSELTHVFKQNLIVSYARSHFSIQMNILCMDESTTCLCPKKDHNCPILRGLCHFVTISNFLGSTSCPLCWQHGLSIAKHLSRIDTYPSRHKANFLIELAVLALTVVQVHPRSLMKLGYHQNSSTQTFHWAYEKLGLSLLWK